MLNLRHNRLHKVKIIFAEMQYRPAKAAKAVNNFNFLMIKELNPEPSVATNV